jgi:hypothetical protein
MNIHNTYQNTVNMKPTKLKINRTSGLLENSAYVFHYVLHLCPKKRMVRNKF